MPRRPRISPSAPAPSSRWRTGLRFTKRSDRRAGAASPPRRGGSGARGGGRGGRTRHPPAVPLFGSVTALRFWNMGRTRFAFGLMTRSKAITYDNLALRAPQFVKQADRLVAREVRSLGFKADTSQPLPPMFQPFRLRSLALENRVVVSPM